MQNVHCQLVVKCNNHNDYGLQNYVHVLPCYSLWIVLFSASKVSSKVVKADKSVKKEKTDIKKEEAAAKVKSESGEIK